MFIVTHSQSGRELIARHVSEDIHVVKPATAARAPERARMFTSAITEDFTKLRSRSSANPAFARGVRRSTRDYVRRAELRVIGPRRIADDVDNLGVPVTTTWPKA